MRRTILTNKGRMFAYSDVTIWDYWWDGDNWIKYECRDKNKSISTNHHAKIRSIKAFKRYIKKHNYLSKGIIFILVSNIVGIKDIEIELKY